MPDTKHHEIKIHSESKKELRPIVGASVGCNVKNVTLPHPDPEDLQTMIDGVKKRSAVKTPKWNKRKLRKFRQFVQRFIKENFKPISSQADISVDTWLDEKQKTYSQARKEELRNKWQKIGGILRCKDFRVKAFMKDEHYTEYKHARGIYSRTDEFKCAVGPIFKLIEEEVFSHPSFIKHVPVRDRPNYVKDMLYRPGSTYIATDYTSFESHFVREIMETIEFELYDYMTSELPNHHQFMNLVRNVIGGWNEIDFKYFTYEIEATRMSGEMCTSLGNGFSNLMLMLFACQENGNENVIGVVEGDDGLFSMTGAPPTESDFKDLGFTIKCETHAHLNEASFCGMIFDIDEGLGVTDPLKKLASFGWFPRRYARSKDSKLLGLLRSKSLSFLFEYPGCPIVSELALYGIRVTEGIHCKIDSSLDIYKKQKIKDALNYYSFNARVPSEIPHGTRLLVERKYGIDVSQQLEIEKYLRSLKSIQELDIDLNWPKDWLNYDERYAFVQAIHDKALEYPCIQF